MRKPILLAVFCMFAAAPSWAQSPGWTLVDTYPDTGGRAPVAPGALQGMGKEDLTDRVCHVVEQLLPRHLWYFH